MKPKPTHAGVHRTEAILKNRISRTFTLVAALTALCASQDAVAQQVDRTVLPIPEPQPPVVTELSAREVSPPARFDVKAPQGAPNVVVVLLDDIGFETNQWAPAIFDGTIRVEQPHSLDYHFTVDMTDQAIAWMQAQHSLTPDKPFFVYFATGALHAPHHVPKEYIDRYRGKFDQGWDALREETFARQKNMGVVPQTADLTPRPKEIPSWASQTPEQKRIEARQMETFAGFGEHTDEQVGRLVQALQEMGVMDNTLFIYIVGDNGASAEGGPEGAYNEMMALNGIINTAAINMPHLEQWGGPS